MGQNRKAEVLEERSKELLFQAAKKLFARHGFDGTTVRDIAREAGVNLSLVSYYFNGKEGLYRACLEVFGRARLAAAERLLQPADRRQDFELRLRQAIEEILAVQLAEPEIAQIVHREIDSNLPVAKETFEDTFLQIFKAWVRFFQHAQDSGWVRSEADPGILAQVVQGTLNHFVRVDPLRSRFFRHTIRDPEHRALLIENFVAVFLKGCLNER